MKGNEPMKITCVPLFLALVFALTFCQNMAMQEAERNKADTSADGKNVENVLCFSDGRDTISFYSTKDDEGEREAASIVEEYLRKRGTFKEKPDSTSFADGSCSIEYYTDSKKQKCSIIMRLLDGSDDYLEVYAITYTLDDFIEIGDIVFDCNQIGDAVSEKFYNTAGELISSITYKYYENIPFPFISKHMITDEVCYKILNRGQRFWLYEDFTIKEETGKVAEYTQDIYSKEYRDLYNFPITIKFTYDANGRLNALSEDFIAEENDPFHEDDWVSDILSLDYYERCALKKTIYCFELAFTYELPHNQRNRGTWYSSGEIHYDKYGRVTYQRDYVAHGYHYSFYPYDGDSKRPWACIEICDMPYSAEENYYYGNETSVYLFR